MLFIGGLFLIFISLQSVSSQEEISNQNNTATLAGTPENQIEISDTVDINNVPLEDNMDLYQYDDPGSLVYMYVTIRKGNPSDNTNHSWQEVNEFSKWFFSNMEHVEVGKAEAIFQIGDENGPIPGEIGYGEIVPNATIQIRGASASKADQKSYKIELRERAGVWRGQGTIDLNKHPYDVGRIKNKLSFDLMKDIPHLTSLRTQFVRLYVKDETSDPPSEQFVDYGLFTQIEQPNKTFLRNHLLDPDGQLYKTNFFEFFRYEDQLQPVDSPTYDPDLFATVLEIKGNQDHTKLIQMLEAVNDWNIPINVTFDKYFDADNYFTWMAFNILVGNVDTQTQNFYLYSPKNSETWYFLPWDYDGAWTRQQPAALGKQEYSLYAKGISNYWGAVLHNRVLRDEINRALLDEKINELRVFLTTERIKELIDVYRETTEPLLFQMPDLENMAKREQYELSYKLILTEVEANYELYLETLESPMPFFLGTPKIENRKLKFNWGVAYDFDAEDITYHFEISRDWAFTDILYEEDILKLAETSVDMLEEGTYFWRVIATNESGYSQYPFDFYKDEEGYRRSGMKYLFITLDREVLEN